MRILSIAIKNFLCYYDDVTKIEFKEGLNLVLGENGYGKSKLYDAFYWVIRDSISGEGLGSKHQETKAIKRGLISERALREAVAGDNIECCVVLQVGDIGSRKDAYEIKRSYNVTKRDDGTFNEPVASTLSMAKKDVLYYKPLPDSEADAKLVSLFSADVLPYMWFQGERGVDSLVDVSRPEALKKIISKLSDVNKWDQYIEVTDDAFERVEKEFNAAVRSVRKDSYRFEELQGLVASKREAIRRREDDLKEYRNKNANAQERLEGVMGRQQNAFELQTLKTSLSGLEKDLAKVIADIDNLEITRPRKEFTESWILDGTEHVFAAFEEKYNSYVKGVMERKFAAQLAKAEEEREQTRLPKNIPDRVHVARMLEEEICLVCNREAKRGTSEYEAIQSLLPELQKVEVKDNSIEPELGKLLTNARVQLQRASTATKGRTELFLARKELQDKKVNLEEEVDSLKNRIGANLGSGENPVDVIATYTNATQEIASTSTQIARCEADLDGLRKSLFTLDIELRNISKGTVNQKLEDKKNHFEILCRAARRLKTSQFDKLIEQLEAETNIHYTRMNQGTGAVFGQIKFMRNGNDGLTPTIIDDEGQRMGNINTSQMTSMKLAIILAITTANKRTDYASYYPLISDAPISDFGLEKSKAFLLDAAETFNQSIIILKDFLEIDPQRPSRFIPRTSELAAIKADVEAKGKKLTIYQLDLPDGLETANRRTLSVTVKHVSV